MRVCACEYRDARGHHSPKAVVTDDSNWEPISDPVEEQQEVLTTAPSL